MDADPPDSVAVLAADPAPLRAAVVEAGRSVVDDAGDADAVVADRAALRSLADDPPGVPVVAVGEDAAPVTVSRDDLGAALSPSARRCRHPVVGVTVGGADRGPALLDVSLVTAEAARISEYGVRASGRRLGAFRADGVVVATPLGAAGYAHAVGGPFVAPGAGLAVVPVAQFATDRSAWVLDPPVACTVVRDEAPVSLAVDGTTVGEVSVGDAVGVAVVDAVDLLLPVEGSETF